MRYLARGLAVLAMLNCGVWMAFGLTVAPVAMVLNGAAAFVCQLVCTAPSATPSQHTVSAGKPR